MLRWEIMYMTKENECEYTNQPKNGLHFFPNVKLFILSSKIAVTEHASLDTLRPISFRGSTSTSTICTTALPSRTLLTLSTSIFLEDDDSDPENASQNAPPRRFRSVCPARAATNACSCSFIGGGLFLLSPPWDKIVCFPDNTVLRVLLIIGGDEGGVGRFALCDVWKYFGPMNDASPWSGVE